MTQDKAKDTIKKLVEKYQEVLRLGQAKKYTEEETKKDFILPLFAALGWDTEDKKEVSAEEHISGDRVDYGFYVNGRPKFYLEAKAFKADINDPKWARQAIKYAWNKGVTWAVLTDFENIKVFNADFQSEELAHSKFFEISYENFIDQFERLQLLSKDSIFKEEIDKEAEAWGKALKRVSVTDALYKDLTECRKLLTSGLKRWNESVADDLLDEGVQKLLNRLVFIRVLEDRNIEPHILKNTVREWDAGKYEKSRPPLYSSLSKKFRELDAQYNSNLFDEHAFEKWEEHDNETKKVIDILYGKSGYYEYDFKIIPADILGAVYENYLGYKLEQLKKGSKVGSDAKKRKEHGIYYTPEFIVDYIIKNAVKPVLDKCTTIDNLMQIKIVDPACGSGSFLIKAVDAVYQRYHELGYRNSPTHKKLQIITENIYGVDLDQQAVEIARLNLLINAVEEKILLPSLAKNIKCGNSLISGTDEELKKYFGLNFRDQKSFNWPEQFPEVFKNGGFDAVIGNPPYIRMQSLNKEEVNYFNETYQSPEKNYDIYILFLEKGYSLLKNEGSLGYILPHKFFQGETGSKIRHFLYKNRAVKEIVDFTTNQIFEGATTYTCLLFINKSENKKFLYKKFALGENFKNLQNISFDSKNIDVLEANPWNFSDNLTQEIINKIKSKKDKFEDITSKIFKGSSTGNDEIFLFDLVEDKGEVFTVFSEKLNHNLDLEQGLLVPFVFGEDIKRYKKIRAKKLLLFPYEPNEEGVSLIKIDRLKISYPLIYKYLIEVKQDLLKRKVKLDDSNFYKYSAARSLGEYKQSKIMIPDMLVRIRIGYDKDGVYFHGPAIHSVVFKEEFKKYDPLFYLGILNSKIFWFFISNTSTALSGDAYRLTPEFLNSFCFPETSRIKKEQVSIITDHAKEIILLEEQFAKLSENSEKWLKLRSEIEKIDHKINDEVYKLYDLTTEEIKIVEDS